MNTGRKEREKVESDREKRQRDKESGQQSTLETRGEAARKETAKLFWTATRQGSAFPLLPAAPEVPSCRAHFRNLTMEQRRSWAKMFVCPWSRSESCTTASTKTLKRRWAIQTRFGDWESKSMVPGPACHPVRVFLLHHIKPGRDQSTPIMTSFNLILPKGLTSDYH